MPTKDAKNIVLVVDDIAENITILHRVLSEKYKVKVATNGEKALEVARTEPHPDIILLDIMMPGMDGYTVCKKLKSDPKTARIPIIFVTGMSEIEDEKRGFQVGAVDYIAKPIFPSIVLARVRTHLALADQQRTCERVVEEQVAAIRKGQRDAIDMLGHAGHYNDDDTGVHIWRMAIYSKTLAKAINWPVEAQDMLLLAAPMHDTGKIGIPDSILKKPGKLTSEEWEIMKTHTTIGHEILSYSDAPVFTMAAEIALSHHERWDGMGYPHKLEKNDIPLSARIVAISDVFDALTMKRPYKPAWKIERAFEYIGDSQGHFDPQLVDIFLSLKNDIVALKNEWDSKEKDKTTISTKPLI